MHLNLTAWFSIFQIMIFQVKEGPWVVRFVQCMEDYGIARPWGKKVYNIVSVLFSFVIPLLIMGTAYGLISGTIARKMRDFKGKRTYNFLDVHVHIYFSSWPMYRINQSYVYNNSLRPMSMLICCIIFVKRQHFYEGLYSYRK